MPSHRAPRLVLSVLVVASVACGEASQRAAPGWAGTMDTLPSGHVRVTNPAHPLWAPDEAWRVTEISRIGRMDGPGPDAFGSVAALQVDPGGRLWILDGQAQEIQVFEIDGRHVRTVGRPGRGPGEFVQAVHIDVGPEGDLWVMDPQNNRLSVFDTAGVYVDGRTAVGGFLLFPWPGGFDRTGHYYAPAPRFDGQLSIVLVRYDASFSPVDTVTTPSDPVQRSAFTLGGDGGGLTAGVPFQGRLVWRVSRDGTLWALVTDQYRMFELTTAGDTLRSITRRADPVPVTEADRDEARADLQWFIRQGGRVDWSELPEAKPLAEWFFHDDEGRAWVALADLDGGVGSRFDVFDRDGRFLGTVRLPFALLQAPTPVARGDTLYGVVRDELDVSYVVVAAIER
jgi:hypothetical protein